MQLEQAISILLTNACDAIAERYGEKEKGQGFLNISLLEKEEWFVITFSDNGCGISSETLEKAFVTYFTTKPHGSGDGLGLPICRSIIKQHGGTIHISSKENHGTEITIELPKKKEEG